MKSKLATAMSIFGCSLLIAAFVVRPTGEIDGSVLTAYATTLTYSAALFGINLKDKQ